MHHKIYYIGIGWDALLSDVQPSTVDQILDPLGDWIRLNDRTWLCSSLHSSGRLYEEIHQRLPQLDRVLVMAIDPTERFGLAPQWIWEWIDGQRQDPPKTAADIIAAHSSAGGSGAQGSLRANEAAEG